MNRSTRKALAYLITVIVGIGAGYALVYHWTNRDTDAVCSFLKYNRSVVDHGVPLVGYCVIDWVGGGNSRVTVEDAYADYVRQLRRQRAVMGDEK